MDIVTLVLLALGLSMDAFAVSVSNAMCYREITQKQAFAASVSFGLFQGIMPTVGFFAGRLVGQWINALDHWLALILLGVIGGKMAFEGVKALREARQLAAEGVDDTVRCPPGQAFTGKTIFVQAIATSIDALAVGISFAALSVNIFSAAALIAVVTFVCCLVGAEIGRRFGLLLGDWAQIAGGLILVGIGLKIFIEHMAGG